jgi:glycosyltransferase involved in cell wall biosynthesis
MKILQVCPRYYPDIGGVEEYVKNTAERLAKQHEVTVFTCDPSGKLLKDEKINGVTVKRYRCFAPGDAYYLSLVMLNELKKSEFNIIHGHNYHAFPLFFARWAKTPRFIVSPHYHGHGHTRFRNFLLKLYKPLGKKIFEDAYRIIADSNYEKNLLSKDFNLNKNNINVIPLGIDTSEFNSLDETPKEHKTILFVGRLEEYKGVQYIIEALPFLEKDFCLKIVGKGPYKANLLTQINKLGLNDRVTFYQDLPRQELLRMYARASVFVLLSKLEAFSIVVAEALASKTPCIVANTTALTEWIDNTNCFGIDYPIKIENLVKLINRVAGNSVNDLKIWDWDKVINNLLKIYVE